MATQYYYARDGKRFGPVSADQLREVAKSGWLRPTDGVWSAELGAWTPAAKIAGLFAAAAPATAAPAPVADPRPVSWGLLLGIGGGAVVALAGLCWLVLALSRPAGDNRPAAVASAEKKEPVVEKHELTVKKTEPVIAKKVPVVEKKEPVVEKT